MVRGATLAAGQDLMVSCDAPHSLTQLLPELVGSSVTT